jgi:hypothetical protein
MHAIGVCRCRLEIVQTAVSAQHPLSSRLKVIDENIIRGEAAQKVAHRIDGVEGEIVLSALHRQRMPCRCKIRVIAQTEHRILQPDQDVDDTRIVPVGIQVGGEKFANGSVLRSIEAVVIMLDGSRK